MLRWVNNGRLPSSIQPQSRVKMFIKLAITINLVLVTLFLAGSGVTASPNEPDANTFTFLPIVTIPPGPIPFGPIHVGDATYYAATGAGNCSFPASPENMMVAAINAADYVDSALCGAYVQVKGANDTIIVRIVDQCPDCPANRIDLSPEAFAELADLSIGVVPISWQLVSYPLSSPIVYHFKEGSNQWWTAVQIRNHSNPIIKLEYQDSNGIFREVSRTSYNYFVQTTPGMGVAPYTFRVTDYFGHTIIDNGIPHIENGDVVGGAQFPPP